MELKYIGTDPAVVGVVPLPEGWPAADHEETDADVAAAKVASGSYRGTTPPKAARAEKESE